MASLQQRGCVTIKILNCLYIFTAGHLENVLNLDTITFCWLQWPSGWLNYGFGTCHVLLLRAASRGDVGRSFAFIYIGWHFVASWMWDQLSRLPGCHWPFTKMWHQLPSSSNPTLKWSQPATVLSKNSMVISVQYRSQKIRASRWATTGRYGAA